MGEKKGGALRRSWFLAWLAATAALVALQSIIHLTVVLDAHRVNSLVDLDRSNGLPDLLSTVVLTAAAVAAALSLYDVDTRIAAGALALGLSFLAIADLLHIGAHPTPTSGKVVIAVVICVGTLLAMRLAYGSTPRVRATLAASGCVLLCSFLVIGLDRMFHRFERERGDPIAEYQIVAKEGLELLGWSLVALAVWDDALARRRGVAGVGVTARASRARAPRRRRVA